MGGGGGGFDVSSDSVNDEGFLLRVRGRSGRSCVGGAAASVRVGSVKPSSGGSNCRYMNRGDVGYE